MTVIQWNEFVPLLNELGNHRFSLFNQMSMTFKSTMHYFHFVTKSRLRKSTSSKFIQRNKRAPDEFVWLYSNGQLILFVETVRSLHGKTVRSLHGRNFSFQLEIKTLNRTDLSTTEATDVWKIQIIKCFPLKEPTIQFSVFASVVLSSVEK